MSISKEQWAKIEGDLKGYFASCTFQYKDIEVSVFRVSAGEGKMVLGVYLNGKIKISWGYREHVDFDPLTELFWHQRSKAYYTPKQVKQIEKIWGKRQGKKEFPKLHESFIWYQPYFSKASVLVRQFKRIEGLALKVDSQGDSL